MSRRAAGGFLVLAGAGLAWWSFSRSAGAAQPAVQPIERRSAGDEILAAWAQEQQAAPRAAQGVNWLGVAGQLLQGANMGGNSDGGGFWSRIFGTGGAGTGSASSTADTGGGSASRTADTAPRPLSQMTVAEVQAWQRQNRAAGAASTAAGRYQIIYGTLGGLVSRGVLDPSERFDAAAQDRAAVALANDAGLADFQRGRIGETDLQQGLSRVWAGLPAATVDRQGRAARGQSYYAGDGLNAATIGREAVLNAIRGLG